jgi:hypothetical protein
MKRGQFFQVLYQCCEGLIELRVFEKAQQLFEIGDIDKINEFCKRYENENIYFGVATRDGQDRDGTKGGRENIVNFPAVWAEFDFKEMSKEAAREKLSQFPFKPSIMIASGGGVHIYWMLKEAAKKSDYATIEDINRRITSNLGADFNSCDAARVLRPTETLNYKYSPPRQVKVLKYENLLYSLDDFLNILPEIAKKNNNNITVNESNWLSDAMKGVSKGHRDATATKIAGYWINKLSASDVLTILKTWNLNNSPPLEDRDLHKIVKSISRYEPDKAKTKVTIHNVYTPAEMLDEYQAYVKSFSDNRFITGIDEIDKKIRGIGGGETLFIIARTGSFKTSMLQNMLKNYIQNSAWGAAFFSLEMPVANVTERYISMLEQNTGKQIEQFYKSESNYKADIAEMEKRFIKNLEGIFTIPINVSLDETAKFVELIQREHNKNIGVIGIDYLGLINGKGQGEYERVSRIARGVKQLSKDLNKPVILVSQVSRKGGAGNVEITLDMARDSGAIEENADIMLGLWQVEHPKVVVGLPGEIIEYDLICRILKNRKGPAGSRWKLDLDAECFIIGNKAEIYNPPQKNKKGVNI